MALVPTAPEISRGKVFAKGVQDAKDGRYEGPVINKAERSAVAYETGRGALSRIGSTLKFALPLAALAGVGFLGGNIYFGGALSSALKTAMDYLGEIDFGKLFSGDIADIPGRVVTEAGNTYNAAAETFNTNPIPPGPQNFDTAVTDAKNTLSSLANGIIGTGSENGSTQAGTDNPNKEEQGA